MRNGQKRISMNENTLVIKSVYKPLSKMSIKVELSQNICNCHITAQKHRKTKKLTCLGDKIEVLVAAPEDSVLHGDDEATAVGDGIISGKVFNPIGGEWCWDNMLVGAGADMTLKMRPYIFNARQIGRS